MITTDENEVATFDDLMQIVRDKLECLQFIRYLHITHNPLRFDHVLTMYGQKKNFSTFSYKLVQISPIVILVNSGAFLSISSWFCELTELIFVMIPYISSTG